MALSSDSLKNNIITEMKSHGFIVEGEFAKAGDLAEAIAKAVVNEINSNAKVIIKTGSSAGEYSIT